MSIICLWSALMHRLSLGDLTRRLAYYTSQLAQNIFHRMKFIIPPSLTKRFVRKTQKKQKKKVIPIKVKINYIT